MPIFGDLRSMNNRRGATHGAIGNNLTDRCIVPANTSAGGRGLRSNNDFRALPEIAGSRGDGSPLLPMMQAMNRGVAERLQGQKRGNDAISGVVLPLVLFAI